MYIVGGFNCYPAEIENILMQMPGVAQAAVIGIPDERMGEVGKAFIIRKAGAADVPASFAVVQHEGSIAKRLKLVQSQPARLAMGFRSGVRGRECESISSGKWRKS